MRLFPSENELIAPRSIIGIEKNFPIVSFADIEGDRGYSFHREYVWTQRSFPKGSLMLSIAAFEYEY